MKHCFNKIWRKYTFYIIIIIIRLTVNCDHFISSENFARDEFTWNFTKMIMSLNEVKILENFAVVR